MATESPKAIASERALLGGLLQAPNKLAEMPTGLTPETFYNPHHGALYALLVDRWSRSLPCDMVTIPEAIARQGQHERYGGVAYVLELPDACTSTVNLPHYAGIVCDMATRRALQAACREAIEAAATVESGERLAAQLAEDVARIGATGGASASDVDGELMSYVTELAEEAKREEDPGYSTGLYDLDRRLGRLRPGLLMLAARPGMGKTALGLNIADAVAYQGPTVGIFSIEMSEHKLKRRQVASRCGIPMSLLKNPKHLTREDWDDIQPTARDSTQLRIRIDPRSTITAPQILARIRQWHAQAPADAPLRLVVIDFLQLVSGFGGNTGERSIAIKLFAMALAGLGEDLGITVLALAQLNRNVESRQNKRPMLSDLAESGGIEQAASWIVFLLRPEYYRKMAGEDLHAVDGLETDVEAIVAKSRDGDPGTVSLAFRPAVVRFEDIEEVRL